MGRRSSPRSLPCSSLRSAHRRDKFIEFLLQRLRDDPKACFEVRASEKNSPDPNRIKDAKDLKRIMKEEQERIRREKEIKSRPRKKR